MKCRACLRSLKNMIPFDENLILYYNLLTNLNVELSVTMPQQLCKHCYKKLQQFITFREKCITANSILIDNTSEEMAKHEDIKQEELTIENNIFYEMNIKNEQDIDNSENKCNIENVISESYNVIDCDGNNSDGNFVYEFTIKTVNKKEKYCMNMPITKEKRMKKKSKTKLLRLPCGLCNLSFENISLASQHLLYHKKHTTCEICKEYFVDWQELLSHRLKHLPRKQTPCHLCLKPFRTPLNMEHHYRKVHSEDEKSMLTCKVCTRSYSTPKKLLAHIRTCHSSIIYICDYCQKKCTTKQYLKLHIIGNHFGWKPFSCDICDFTTKFSSSLKLHKLNKHTPKKVICQKCTLVFPSTLKLEKHKCKETSVICPVCGKVLKVKRMLGPHMKSHDTSRRFRCDLCDAEYRSRGGLRVHIDKHNGVRRHRCEYCPASFYSASVLIKHRRTHTGIKPYVCKVCNKGFTGNYSLKVHMRVHGEYLVKTC